MMLITIYWSFMVCFAATLGCPFLLGLR